MPRQAVFEFQRQMAGHFLIPEKRVYKKSSDFQEIELFNTERFGKVLRIDGYFQTSENDEFLYHESLVHAAMCCHPNPERVLIVGGGDGGCLEEVLKHSTVKEATLVEIDKLVVELSKKYLKSINGRAFEDRRTRVVFKDGFEFLEKTAEKFDVIIVDLSEPLGPALKLFTKEFYSLAAARLGSPGVLAMHGESPYIFPEILARELATVKSAFKNVSVFFTYIPIFGTAFPFAVCSDELNAAGVDTETVEHRLRGRGVRGLKYYSGKMHSSVFVLPGFMKEIIGQNAEPITLGTSLKEIEREFRESGQGVKGVSGNRPPFWGMSAAIDLYGCDAGLVRDGNRIKEFARKCVGVIKARAYGEPLLERFGEGRVAGYSMMQLIETSLVSGHFVDESNAAYLDVFSCKEFDPEKVEGFAKKFFKAKESTLQVSIRR